MTERLFDTLVPRVSTVATGCPTPTIIAHVRDAATRVCRLSLFWRQELRQTRLLPGVYEYAFATPAGAEVAAVFGVLVDERPLEVVTLEEAIRRYPGWADLFSGVAPEDAWSQTTPNVWNSEPVNSTALNSSDEYQLLPAIVEKAGAPQVVTQLTPHRFAVLPLPDNERAYTTRIIAALKPGRAATSLPQGVFDEIEDAVFHGALQHLMAIPNRSWSSTEQASYHARLARHEISMLRARVNLTVHRGTLVAQGPRFG